MSEFSSIPLIGFSYAPFPSPSSLPPLLIALVCSISRLNATSQLLGAGCLRGQDDNVYRPRKQRTMYPGGGAAKVRRLSAIHICISQQEYLFPHLILRLLAQGSEKDHLRSIALDLRCTKGGRSAGPEKTLSLPLYFPPRFNITWRASIQKLDRDLHTLHN